MRFYETISQATIYRTLLPSSTTNLCPTSQRLFPNGRVFHAVDHDDLLSEEVPSWSAYKATSQDSCRCFHDITPGLTQTRRGLRSFINTNAARLCNLAIRSPFPLEAELLETKFNGSWPVVGHQGLPGPLPGIESDNASDRSYIAQTRLPRTLRLSRIH